MILKVTIKNTYGNELVYPACENAKLLTSLLNSKTFTQRHIDILKRLDYQFEHVAQSI